MAADPKIVDMLTALHDRHVSDQDIIQRQDEEIGRLREECLRLKKMVKQHAQSLMDEARTGGVPAVGKDVLAALVANTTGGYMAQEEASYAVNMNKNPLADSFVL